MNCSHHNPSPILRHTRSREIEISSFSSSLSLTPACFQTHQHVSKVPAGRHLMQSMHHIPPFTHSTLYPYSLQSHFVPIPTLLPPLTHTHSHPLPLFTPPPHSHSTLYLFHFSRLIDADLAHSFEFQVARTVAICEQVHHTSTAS